MTTADPGTWGQERRERRWTPDASGSTQKGPCRYFRACGRSMKRPAALRRDSPERAQSRRRVTTKASSLNHRPPCFCSTRLRRLQVGPVGHDRIKSLVLDLVHVDRGVPGGEQRRGADAVADLRGQRVHLVAKHRLLIGQGGQVEFAGIAAELAAQRAPAARDDRPGTGCSCGHSCWTISSPGSRPHDWIASSRPPGARLRVSGASTFCDLELRAHARPPGLRGENQVVVLEDAAGLRDHAHRAGTCGPRGRCTSTEGRTTSGLPVLRAGLGLPAVGQRGGRAPRSARRTHARLTQSAAPPAS